ncbi:MAG TPA: hypothetical protein VGG70_06140 [Candidatus Cybelea sp.]|jgi:hypothetical protein
MGIFAGAESQRGARLRMGKPAYTANFKFMSETAIPAAAALGAGPLDAPAQAIIPQSSLPFNGGLFFEVFRRAGADEAALQRARTVSILILPLIAWLPLVVLSAFDGQLLRSATGTPFLRDYSAHIRLLVALPLFLIAGRVAEARIRPTLQQFLTRQLVPPQSMEKFKASVASAFRLGDSVLADIVILALIYSVDLFVVRRTGVAAEAAAWYANPSKSGPVLTIGGIYYAYVSLPILQFILLRWYYRLFIWGRFLRQTARLGLRLIPTHADRVGGLGFLITGTQAFTFFAIAQGTLLTAWLATPVIVGKAPLPEFKAEIVVVVVFVLLLTVSPLLSYLPVLARTKRRGSIDYGALATRYGREFDEKWVHGHASSDEPFIGSADIQSLADMGNSYAVIADMRSLPVTPQMLVGFGVATLLPVAPLLLTLMPLSAILKKLAGILLPGSGN